MQKCSYFLRFASVRLFWRKIDALLQDGWAKGASRIKLDALLQAAWTDGLMKGLSVYPPGPTCYTMHEQNRRQAGAAVSRPGAAAPF